MTADNNVLYAKSVHSVREGSHSRAVTVREGVRNVALSHIKNLGKIVREMSRSSTTYMNEQVARCSPSDKLRKAG